MRALLIAALSLGAFADAQAQDRAVTPPRQPATPPGQFTTSVTSTPDGRQREIIVLQTDPGGFVPGIDDFPDSGNAGEVNGLIKCRQAIGPGDVRVLSYALQLVPNSNPARFYFRRLVCELRY
jgi:hypothetical protein